MGGAGGYGPADIRLVDVISWHQLTVIDSAQQLILNGRF